MILIDSAGLRNSADPVERIGIARAREALAGADLVVWLGDAAEAPAEALVVHARSDVPGRPEAPAGTLAVSAISGLGLEALRAVLVERCRALLPAEDAVALNARHRAALGDAADALEAALELDDAVLVAEQLRLARVALDRITGRSGVEDMLDALFGQFCIGK